MMSFRGRPIAAEDLNETAQGADEETEGDQCVSDRDDDDEVPTRKVQDERRFGFHLQLHERHRRLHEQIADDRGEETGDDEEHFAGLLGHEFRQELDAQMASFPGGDDRAEISHPQHQMTEEDIPPFNAGIEEVTEDHLSERHQDHDAEQADEDPAGDPFQPKVEDEDWFHTIVRWFIPQPKI